MSAIVATLSALLLRVRFALLLALFAPAQTWAASLYSGTGPRPGPDVLYAPPVSAPQFQNESVWQAPPILISGATAYRRGEFLYQDFLYDDRGAGDASAYPNDARYAGNAADIVELRLKPLGPELAVRITYNTMVDRSIVAATIALGDSKQAVSVPYNARAIEPARVFVTIHGDSADAIDAQTGAVLAPSLPTAVNGVLRQVEVRVPYSVFDPRGDRHVRVAAAAGLWDPAGQQYVPQAGASFFNVAFRGEEPASPWRTALQAEALESGDLSAFSAEVDFVRLANGTDDERDVPMRGFMDRILVSATEERQGRGDAISRKPGCDAPCVPQYAGRLQPYELYVPPGPVPAGGWGLTLDLHGCGQTHNIGFDSKRQRQLGERQPGSIVLSPEARGDCYWYFGPAAADVFEAWADVARTYPLNPELTTITGVSMGGYGAYKLAASYPDLFARAGVVVPCPGAGIAYTAIRGTHHGFSHQIPPGGRSRLIEPLLPSLAWVPVMSWQTTGDQACEYAAQAALVARLAALGYRYSSLTFSGIDHKTLAAAVLSASEPLAYFFGDARVMRDPPRVVYVMSPAMHEPARGLAADHAYWVSGITLADPRAAGRVDVTSYGIGAHDSGVPAETQGGGDLHGLSYVSAVHLGGTMLPDTPQPRLRIATSGIRALAIDAERARSGCRPSVEVSSLTPLDVRLQGCDVTYSVRRDCHSKPRFTLRPVAPAGERLRSLKVRSGGRTLAPKKGRVKIDARKDPDLRVLVRVVAVDPQGRTHIRLTTHLWCR